MTDEEREYEALRRLYAGEDVTDLGVSHVETTFRAAGAESAIWSSRCNSGDSRARTPIH